MASRSLVFCTVLATFGKYFAMSDLPVTVIQACRLLIAEAYQRLADVAPEIEWFANLGNKRHPARV
jgi:hypothetical protein